MEETNDSTAVVEARLAILEIDTQLADLREQRNHKAAPLCQVPDEIIIKIYREFQAQWIDQYGLHIGRMRWWGAYLSLCRRIRSVTQQASELWTFIQIGGDDDRDLKDTNWRTTCLQRARNAPLTLRIYLPHLNYLHQDILPLAHRTSELDIFMLHSPDGEKPSPYRLESLLGGIHGVGAQWPICGEQTSWRFHLIGHLQWLGSVPRFFAALIIQFRV